MDSCVDKDCDKEQIRGLLMNSVISLCKNGIPFKRNIRVQGLLGITIDDDDDTLLIEFNENVENESSIALPDVVVGNPVKQKSGKTSLTNNKTSTNNSLADMISRLNQQNNGNINAKTSNVKGKTSSECVIGIEASSEEKLKRKKHKVREKKMKSNEESVKRNDGQHHKQSYELERQEQELPDCLIINEENDKELDCIVIDGDGLTQSTSNDPVTGSVRLNDDQDNVRDASVNENQYNRCYRCSKTFSSVKRLNQHIKRQHVIDGLLRCTECEKLFTNKHYFFKHIHTVHGEKKHKCNICDFSATLPSKLKQHYDAVHIKLKPYICRYCEYCSSKMGNLQRHVRNMHDLIEYQEKRYKCSACDKKFSKYEHRAKHYRLVHLEEKRYSCEQCEYKCSDPSDLQQHQRAAHKRVKDLPCVERGHKFSEKNYLKKHTNSVEKPHKCIDCKKSFVHKVDLRLHVNTAHDNLKPHTCTVCDKTFKSRYKLQKHIKAVHPGAAATIIVN